MVSNKYLYLWHHVETIALVTFHLVSGFEHIKRGLWKVKIFVRSKRVNIEKRKVTTRMGPCSGLSAGQSVEGRESKVEELHCHPGAEGHQSTGDKIRTSLTPTGPITFLTVMQEEQKQILKGTHWVVKSYVWGQ